MNAPILNAAHRIAPSNRVQSFPAMTESNAIVFEPDVTHTLFQHSALLRFEVGRMLLTQTSHID
jgi:hypothetical protein